MPGRVGRARCTKARSASVQAVVVSRYSPAASGTKAATATVKYGTTRARTADTDAAVLPRVASGGRVAVGRVARAAGVRAGLVAGVRVPRAAGVPGPLAVASGAVAAAPAAVAGTLTRRTSLADSQPMPASSSNRPANTAPCALN